MRQLIERLESENELIEMSENEYKKVSKKLVKYFGKLIPKLKNARDYLSQERIEVASKDIGVAVDALQKAIKDLG